MIFLSVCLQLALDQLPKLLFPLFHRKRQHKVKNNVCVAVAAHHAKIVDGKLRVDLLQNFRDLRVNPAELLVVGHNRVIVDD